VPRDNHMALAILDDTHLQLEAIERHFTPRLQAMRNNLNRYRLQAIALRNSLCPTTSCLIFVDVENMDDTDHA
jgi:hypothetical protein